MMSCYDPECTCPACDGTSELPTDLQSVADSLAAEYDYAVLLERETAWAHLDYMMSLYETPYFAEPAPQVVLIARVLTW